MPGHTTPTPAPVTATSGDASGGDAPVPNQQPAPTPPPGRTRSRWIIVGIGVTIAIVVVGLVWAFLRTGSPLASDPAGPTDQDLNVDAEVFGLTVQTGWDGEALRGTWTPLTVEIAPGVPIQGTLKLHTDSDFGPLVQAFDVQVQAGTTKRFTLLLPPAHNADVSLAVDGQHAAVSVPGATGTQQVAAVLGDETFEDRVGAVTDPITGDVWVTTNLDPALLDHGPLTLDGVATVVATSQALDALSDTARQALTTAVTHEGVHLLVTDVRTDPGIGHAPATVTGSDLVPVPSAFAVDVSVEHVTSGDREGAVGATVVSGTGRVTWLTNGVDEASLAAPQVWGQLFTGGVAVSSFEQPPFEPWELMQDGLVLPSSWAMAGFVALWLLVVVALARMATRMARRERAWIVIPAVSLVVASVAFAFAGGNDQSGTGTAFAKGTWIDGSGTHELGLLGNTGAAWHLDGRGWTGRPLTFSDNMVMTTDGDGLRVEVDQGQTVLTAHRAFSMPSPIQLEAVETPAGFRAEVTNTTDTALQDVRLQVPGGAGAALGTLDPEQTVVVQAPHDADTAVVDGTDEVALTTDKWQAGPPDDEGEAAHAWTADARTMIDQHPSKAWVLARADGVLPASASGPSSVADVLVVGATPTSDAQGTNIATVAVWQPQRGGHELDTRTMILQGTGTTFARHSLQSAAGSSSVSFDLPLAGENDNCSSWEVWDENGGTHTIEELCDGEQPECPADVDFCEQWDEGVSWCGSDGCEDWTLVGGGARSVDVWDRHDSRWRPWDPQALEAATADPTLVVGPLGDVVVRIDANGPIRADGMQVATGAPR